MKKSDLILPDYPVQRGDRGLNVSRLQACLDVLYKHKGKKKLESVEPAYCGAYTHMDLLTFQQEYCDKTTGVYDRHTRQKLREVLNAN